MSEAAKKRCENHKPITILGKKIMNKNGIKKFKEPEQFDIYLKDGWSFGRS
jgi:hypothetical protein